MRFCPRCHLELGEIEQAGLVVELCAQCRGIFCDRGELEALVGGGVDSKPATSAVEDEVACPACNAAMAWRSAQGTSFLSCRGCGGSWLEKGVVAALRSSASSASLRPASARSAPPAAARAIEEARALAPSSGTSRDRVLDDRLSFDAPLVDLLAYPIAFTIATLVGVVGIGRIVAFIVQIWFHEVGHAVPAWLSGRAALPLPFGFTFWREDPSIFTTLCVSFLIVVFGVASVREKRPFAIAVAAVLLGLQLLCTFVIDAEAMIEWILFGGLAGELVLSTLAVVAFFYRAPDRFRWDFFRFVVLVPAATVFVSSLAMWIRIDRGEQALPLGSIIGAPGDGTGDLDRLMASYDWSGQALTDVYRAIGLVCLAVIGAHYAFFGLRAWRRRAAGRSADSANGA